MGKDKIKDALEALNSIDNKEELTEKIEELGKGNIKSNDLEKITKLASKLKNDYNGKNEEELLKEISNMKENVDINRLKKTLVENRQVLKHLYNMMDDKNRERMEKVLNILKDE